MSLFVFISLVLPAQSKKDNSNHQDRWDDGWHQNWTTQSVHVTGCLHPLAAILQRGERKNDARHVTLAWVAHRKQLAT